MTRRLGLFGAYHFDRPSKVQRELAGFVEDTDADVIFVEWPAEKISRRTVARAALRAPAVLFGILSAGLLQASIFLLFNRRLDSTEHLAAKRLADDYSVYDIDRNLYGLVAESGWVAVVVNWSIVLAFLAVVPIQTVVTTVFLSAGGFLMAATALKSRRLAALVAAVVLSGLTALAVITDLLAEWFILVVALAFAVFALRTLDTRNEHMAERAAAIAREEGYDSSVLVTGKAHLSGLAEQATDRGFTLSRTYTPRWLRAPGKIEDHSHTELDDSPEESRAAKHEETTTGADKPTDELGSVSARAAATLVDFIVLAVLVWIPALVFGFTTEMLVGDLVLGFLAGFILTPFGYYVVLEATFGRTIGKHLEELVVTDADGSPVSTRACLLRNLLRPVDFLLFYALGAIIVSLTERRQRFGDLVAGTEVRKTE